MNQAVNYLTIGLANAFAVRFDEVALITGSIHVQGEELEPSIDVSYINHWLERPAWKKLFSYLKACFLIYWLLLTKYRRYEVLFVSLPPMGYLLSLILPNRCSMVIWDVYPDIFKITGMQESHWLYRIWGALNKITLSKAYRVFTIGDRMADLLEKYVDRRKIIIQPIWSIFQANERASREKNPFIKNHQLQDKFIVQYSGNIGLTHKVEIMVELAEKMQNRPDIIFQVIGRGPRKPILEKLVRERQLPNCKFLPFQSDEMFPYSLSAADLGVVVLDERTAKGSVPSKSYNLMSYGIPSLYIASNDSQLKLYADQFRHAACFTEAELDQAVNFILQLKEDQLIREQLSQNAQVAADNFKRENADKFVTYYLDKADSQPFKE